MCVFPLSFLPGIGTLVIFLPRRFYKLDTFVEGRAYGNELQCSMWYENDFKFCHYHSLALWPELSLNYSLEGKTADTITRLKLSTKPKALFNSAD